MSIIAFIPVRGGSKSIPLKNIKDFCGKPLVYWNVLALQNTSKVNCIVVATDSDEIEECVNAFNFSKVTVYRRSAENANDTASTESVMLEYLELNKDNLNENDIFILAQATSPLTQSSDFEKALKLYFENSYDSLLTCVRQKRFFWNPEGTPKNYDYKNRPRRQDFDGELMENGAFYISTVGGILESKNRLSGKIGIYEMPEYTTIEIDEPEDWMVAEKLMKRYVLPKTEQNKSEIKLFLTDVDGVLTDAGMYYSEKGDELKKFNTHDGMAFQLLRERGIKTGIITSENTEIVKRRAEKLKVDYLSQGDKRGKLAVAKEICEQEGITLNEVAYIGDDINCLELLLKVGFAACPNNALLKVKKSIPNINILSKKGGEGVVREFVEMILNETK